MDACVPAFTTVTPASDTNGSGSVHSGLDTVWTRGADVFGQERGIGGMLAPGVWRKDF